MGAEWNGKDTGIGRELQWRISVANNTSATRKRKASPAMYTTTSPGKFTHHSSCYHAHGQGKVRKMGRTAKLKGSAKDFMIQSKYTSV